MIKLDKKPTILVIGDLILDYYLYGTCDRISPEAPVQIINVKKEEAVLGGAGNVVNNLISFGANVDLISVIGDDNTASELKRLLEEININFSLLIKEDGRISTKKTRLIAFHQQVIRYDVETVEDIKNSTVDKICDYVKNNIRKYDSVIISDYAKGLLTDDLTKKIIKISNQNFIKVLVDPKGNNYDKYKGAYTLTPNKKEAMEATGIEIIDENSIEKVLQKMKIDFQLDVSIITLSENGIAVYDDEFEIKSTIQRDVYDVTGAGDTVIASIAFALENGLDIRKSINFANLAAGVVVGKIGNGIATLEEIYEYESNLKKSTANLHIKDFKEIEKIAKKFKKDGKKVIFTNGCFDLLHIGHIKYLEKAKSFGDILILGLNSDSSVKRIKGEERPLISQEERAYILASLESVDYVVVFDEETPYELIKLVKPNIIVKGGDYKEKKIVGDDLAEIRIVDFIDGKSTTNLIKKIQCQK